VSKISNILNMILLLQNKRRYSIKELADKLEVTERMIRFYKEELEQAGIFIDTIRGPYGGYVLNDNVSFPNRKITKEDVNLLKEIKNNNTKLATLIDKLEGMVISETNSKETILNENNRDKYNTFVKASKEKIKVEIEYLSVGEDKTKKRVIHPLDMFLYNDGWNVSGYCELRNDIRNFAFSRIIDFQLLNEKFK
jgi:predicted DNA-binding transcriptional regulator YafY